MTCFDQRSWKRAVRQVVSGAGFCLSVAGCGAQVGDDDTGSARSAAVGSTAQRVVVGDDDRTDVYAHPDAEWRERAQRSTVALLRSFHLDESDPNDVQVSHWPVGWSQNLCTSERFFTQNSRAFCSGTLIDHDLVLTAGHCVTSQSSCDTTRFVFNYRMENESVEATITADDVYSCDELLVSTVEDFRDHAIVRLDRSVTAEHEPVPVLTAQVLEVGEPIGAIGHPSGVPTKIDTGGEIIEALDTNLVPTLFRTTSDTFPGNSGSGMFLESGVVAGIHTHGSESAYVQSGSCNVVNVVPEGTESGSARYAYHAVRELCASEDEDSTLCGSDSPVCGDGVCEAREQYADCPADCPAIPPDEWSCNISQYKSAIDGWCFCACGADDPDCAQLNHFVIDCDNSESCVPGGGGCTSTIAVPGRFQALKFARFEDFTEQHFGNCDTNTPVDIETSSDSDGSRCNIAYTEAGEWLEYDLSVEQAGSYRIGLRLAASAAGKSVRVLVNGSELNAAVSVPSEGWQAFDNVDVGSVALSAGEHTLRVEFTTGDTNLAYLDVVAEADGVALPALIEAEDYDRAYESTPDNNSGGQCDRGDGVDMQLTGDASGNCNVGWTTSGEWLEYDVFAPEAGDYFVTARVASRFDGMTFSVQVDGVDTGSAYSAPADGWQVYSDVVVPVQLSAGHHSLRITFESGNVNLNYLNVVSISPAVEVPALIPAEEYVRAFESTPEVNSGGACDRGDGVDMQLTGDTTGECNIGWTSPFEWVEYDFFVPEAGNYWITARVASKDADNHFSMDIDGVNAGSDLPSPGDGWQTYTDVNTNLFLTEGYHTLRVLFVSGGINLNYVRITDELPVGVSVPALIEAEDYDRHFESTPGVNSGGECDRGDGVDMQLTGDATGECNVGWTSPGEWLEFDLYVEEDEPFIFSARAASAQSGTSFRLSVNGSDMGFSFPVVGGGWQNYSDITTGLDLDQGNNTLRITFETGGTNLNYFEVVPFF